MSQAFGYGTLHFTFTATSATTTPYAVFIPLLIIASVFTLLAPGPGRFRTLGFYITNLITYRRETYKRPLKTELQTAKRIGGG